jgi:FixJ family two-component response regulator
MTVRAMKAGASDFLTKPFRDEDLLAAVTQALHHSRPLAPLREQAEHDTAGKKTTRNHST